MNSLIDECLSDKDLHGFIHHYARRIAGSLHWTYDIEDGKQELWTAVISAVQHYDYSRPLSDFARSAVYSRYGNIQKLGQGKSATMYHEAQRCECDIGMSEDFTELADAKITLDSIEADLKTESNTSKQWKIALQSIQFIQDGYNQKEISELIGVSHGYVKNVMMKLRKRVAVQLSV